MRISASLSALIAVPLLAVAPAQAAPFTVSGQVNFVAAGSDVGNATGQAIRAALEGQSATLSITVDPSVGDTDPAAGAIELRGAVTASSALIGGFAFTAGATPCLNLDFDCRATAELNAFGTAIDLQTLSSQVLADAGFGLGSLTFFLSTSGNDLFTTPQIVDPTTGSLTAGLSVFYVADNALRVVRFGLDATPVPLPGTLPLAALGLGLLALRRRA